MIIRKAHDGEVLMIAEMTRQLSTYKLSTVSFSLLKIY